jgi:hypothetical protein
LELMNAISIPEKNADKSKVIITVSKTSML